MTHILSHLITIQRRLIFYALAMVPMKFAIGISTRFHVSGFSRFVSGRFSSLVQCVWLSPMRKSGWESYVFPSTILYCLVKVSIDAMGRFLPCNLQLMDSSCVTNLSACGVRLRRSNPPQTPQCREQPCTGLPNLYCLVDRKVLRKRVSRDSRRLSASCGDSLSY